MSFFQALVDQYLGRTPDHFDRIASRLRNGQSALSVRRQLREEFDLSRLQAGKKVEYVEKAIRAWRVSLGTGVGLILVAFSLVSPWHPAFWIAMLFGVAQAVAGMRGMHTYQHAVDPTVAPNAPDPADDPSDRSSTSSELLDSNSELSDSEE